MIILCNRLVDSALKKHMHTISLNKLARYAWHICRLVIMDKLSAMLHLNGVKCVNDIYNQVKVNNKSLINEWRIDSSPFDYN